MTQIARSVATMGSMTMGSGRVAGMKPGAAGDFAAIVAGLGLSGEENALTATEGFALGGDAVADGDAGTGTDGEGRKGGEPVILDLALGAAAQSAVADMVVAPPMQLIVSPPASSSDGGATDGLPSALLASAGIERDVAAPRRARTQLAETGLASPMPIVPGQARATSQAYSPAPAFSQAQPAMQTTIPTANMTATTKSGQVQPATQAIVPTVAMTAATKSGQAQPVMQTASPMANPTAAMKPGLAQPAMQTVVPTADPIAAPPLAQAQPAVQGMNPTAASALATVASPLVQASTTPVAIAAAIAGDAVAVRSSIAPDGPVAASAPPVTAPAMPVGEQKGERGARPVSAITPSVREQAPLMPSGAMADPARVSDPALLSAVARAAVPATPGADITPPAAETDVVLSAPLGTPVLSAAPAAPAASNAPASLRKAVTVEALGAHAAPDTSAAAPIGTPAPIVSDDKGLAGVDRANPLNVATSLTPGAKDPVAASVAVTSTITTPVDRAMPYQAPVGIVSPAYPQFVAPGKKPDSGTAPVAALSVPESPSLSETVVPAALQSDLAVTVPLASADKRQQPVGAPLRSAAEDHVVAQASVEPAQLAQLRAEPETPISSSNLVTAQSGIAVPRMPMPAQAEEIVPASAQALAQAPARAAYAAVQPVMSTIQRVGTAPADPMVGNPASMTMMASDAARSDPATASDSGTGRESGGAGLASDRSASASALAESLPGGRQFADIIQSLPPIAQGRIGAVGDVAPAVAGPVDVGASLQGQVIDMTVGGQWIDRMAQEITALAEGKGHSRFQLSPPHLGRIQIDVWQGEGGGRVQLLTETDEAAQHLRDGQSNLQGDARLAALQLGSITIERAMNGLDTPLDQNTQPQQQNSNQQQSGRQSAANEQNGQGSTQTSTQGGSQQNMQQNAQTALQAGLQGGNSGGQGKNSPRRDVLNHQGDTVNQQGGSTGRDGDRLVRYA